MGFGELLRRLKFAAQRERRVEEIDEEMRLHLELRRRTLEERGIPEQSAVAAARGQFGNRTSWKEAARDVWSFAFLENWWRDLAFGARVLRHSPTFSVIAVVTLALGIGATTAMFSVIDNVLLEPFPYAHQQRLFAIVIHNSASGQPGGRSMFFASEFLDYREQNRVFEDVMGVAINRALWTPGGTPESVNAPLVTPNAFQFLGVPALLGRIATPADAQGDAAAVCVMSYSFWKGRFAGDPHVVGKVLTLDGAPRTVIGVMPPRFIFWSADVWIPTALRRDAGLQPPWFELLGRLKEGMAPATGQRQLEMVARGLARKYRQLYPPRFDVNLESFADTAVGRFRHTLFTLLAAVGLLLLIACGNVASLLLARVSTRQRELAVRTSLGAGWWRIVRQLFLESGIIAFAGAALGCAFAWGGLQLLMAVLPRDTFPEEAVIALNVRVLLATVAVAVATALFFGLVPVLGGLRQDIHDALKSGGRQHSGFRRSRLRNVLIVAEVAVSLVLLSAAGVMMRSFLREREIPLGLSPQHLLSAEIFLTKAHRTAEEQARFNRELTAALRRVPGVLDVATTTDFLPFGGMLTRLEIPGQARAEQVTGQVSMIDPDLFRTIGVPLLEGRNLTEVDLAGRHMVAVVNRTLAEKFFPRQDPIGQRIQTPALLQGPSPVANQAFEIVGIVPDFKNGGLREPIVPEVFVPYTIAGLGGFGVLVRTVGDPQAVGKTVEGTALDLDHSTVVRHIRTLQDALEADEYAKPRFGLEIFAVFASLGLLLVSAGLYSVTSYTVSQRKREMGIRVALGATPGDVQTLVIGTELRFVLGGIVAGLVLSFVLLQVIQSQVWGVSTHDPMTLAAVAGILILVGIAASYVPSLSATRVDPAQTLRAE
jgi:putative ABC transport system permease protein